MKLLQITGWHGSLVAGVVGVLLAATSAQADLFSVADFNDLTTGNLSGKSGGTGFTGNWSGSAGGTVVAGNLTSSLYNVLQSGTAQHFRNVNATGLRQNYRNVSGTPNGDVWFSYLARVDSATSRAGLSLNAPTGSPFSNTGNVYAYLTGSTLNYSFGTGTAGTAAAAAVGSTNLIVGKMNIVNGGADAISLWLNPDLIANPDINTLSPIYSGTSTDFIDALSWIGAVGSGDNSSTGGHVDNIRFSDGGGDSFQAYADVTGVTAIPEPSSALLVSFAAAAWWRARRRNAPASAGGEASAG